MSTRSGWRFPLEDETPLRETPDQRLLRVLLDDEQQAFDDLLGAPDALRRAAEAGPDNSGPW